jgi:hypothetical protein
MHAAKMIAITGSIERRSTLGIQWWQDDDTKAYGARIWSRRSPMIPATAFVQARSLIAHPGPLTFAIIVNISQSLRGAGSVPVAFLTEINRSHAELWHC